MTNRGKVVDCAQGEAVADVAGRAFLKRKVAVVLRDGRLEHRGAKVRRVAQVLGESIVSQERKATRETPADVNVPGVVPTPRRVLKKVDAADGKRRVRNSDVVG